MIGSSKEVDGLYLFEDEFGPKEKLQKNCLNSIPIHEDEEIMLWHYRLGHPNFLYLKHLFPDLFKNKIQICFLVKFVNLQNIIVPLIPLRIINNLVHSP